MSEPRVGDRARREHVFTDEQVRAFVELTGDDNAVHLDDAAARAMGFGGRIVHGLLVTSLVGRLLGTELPGRGTIYLGQQLTFRKPVGIGVPVVAEVEIVERREDKPIFTLRTTVSTPDGVAIDGTATVLLRLPEEAG
jgi:acyl dehydratase